MDVAIVEKALLMLHQRTHTGKIFIHIVGVEEPSGYVLTLLNARGLILENTKNRVNVVGFQQWLSPYLTPGSSYRLVKLIGHNMAKLLVEIPFYLTSEINHKVGRIHKLFLIHTRVPECNETLHCGSLQLRMSRYEQLCSTYALDLPPKHNLRGVGGLRLMDNVP